MIMSIFQNHVSPSLRGFANNFYNLRDFGRYILLTNFQGYLDEFAEINQTDVVDRNVAIFSKLTGIA